MSDNVTRPLYSARRQLLTIVTESKDWSLVLNTTVGDSYIQDDSDEDIPITVHDLSIAQVMD